MPGLLVVVVKGYPRLSETFIAQELLGLQRAGLRFLIVSMRHPTDATSHPAHREIRAPILYLPEYLYHDPLRVVRGLVRAARLPGFRRGLVAWLADLPRDFTPSRFRRLGQAAVLAAEMPADARWLYAHFIHTPSAVTRYAGIMTGLAWSCSAHAKDIWTSPEWELRQNLAEAQWVVTCTRTGLERLQSLASPPERVRLIYHGVDLGAFRPRPQPLSRRDGRDSDDPVRLLTVGRAVEKKGFDLLLEALERLPPGLNWSLTHIGGGELLERLRKRARALGLHDRIIWRGPQSQGEVLAAYRGADLFVLPCRVAANGDRDGLPNVLVEALSQRLACLSTRVGGVPELIGDGETGLLVPPDDCTALADGLARLIRDPGLRERLGVAGERRARTQYDMRAGIADLVAILESSLAGPEGARALEAAQ